MVKETTVPAKVENLDDVMEFITKDLLEECCSEKVQMQIALAVEEIFMNIVNYAYRPKDGEATIRCSVGGDPIQIIIQFMDKGWPYNPLSRKDPDITLAAEERDIGGLGIFLVKKSMDSVDYEYVDGKNILTIRKKL